MTFVPGSTPYAWPFDGDLDPARCALVLCGSGPSWSQRCPLDPDVTTTIAHLRASLAPIGVTIALVRHDALPPRQPARVPIIDGPSQLPLDATGDEIEVHAAGIDGFYGSPLDSTLRSRGCNKLLFAGHGFETVVHSTLRRANDRGYECLTISDACALIDPTMHAAAVSTIQMSGGIFGAVGTTNALLHALDLTQPET